MFSLLTILVLLVSSTKSQGARTNLVAFHDRQDASGADGSDVVSRECTHEARASDSKIFDVSSLIFDDPDFTYFDSWEFFLSPVSACDRELDVALHKVPNSTEAKRIQQEMRFKVKRIKEGLNALKKQQTTYAKEMLDRFRKADLEEIPAVELHMFPKNPLDVESTWQVLVVPKARQLFGKTIYLCRPKGPDGLGARGSSGSPTCAAKLSFSPLPPRFMNLFGQWDPVLDPLRSVPHRWILAHELFLLVSVLSISWKAIFPLGKLVALMWREEGTDESDSTDHAQRQMESLAGEQLPKTYKLARHANVFKDPTGEEKIIDTALDPCVEVTVLEMKRSEGNITGSLPHRLIKRMKGIFTTKAFEAIWGRVENPKGWIVLYDSASDWKGIVLQEKPPYRANQQLMVPIGALLRRQLVLATSHASVQWLLLDKLASLVQVNIFIAVTFSFFCVHVLVLRHAETTVKWGLRCDQVLEKGRLRLRPPDMKVVLQCLALILVVMTCALLLGLTVSWSTALFTPCLALLVGVLLHAWDFYLSFRGLTKWREPELSSEFTEYRGEPLQSTNTKPPSLTKAREAHYLVSSTLTWLFATGGMSVLMLLGSDALHMRGELLDYSFNKGHLRYVAGATGLENTLLLHDAADSITFVFEGGDHTESIHLQMDHPQMDLKDVEKVTLFPQKAEGNRGGKKASAGGEYQLNLPAGPLYSRIIVEAASKLKIVTKYTFHLIRVGEAISLSLSGKVAVKQHEPEEEEADSTGHSYVSFVEGRRWLYQKQMINWYVPRLDGNASLEVQLDPVCFAPLLRARSFETSPLVQFADKCRCGDERMGFGNDCGKETMLQISTGKQICLFLRSAENMRELRINNGKGSLAKGLGLINWLQDVNVSGKFAGLRIEAEESQLMRLEKDQGEPEELILSVQNRSEFQISTKFSLSMTAGLLIRSTQLVVATTQDNTDAEEQTVPFKIVPHAPPINLTTDIGFILPSFALANKRNEYFVCVLPDLKSVRGVAVDTRFHVESQEVQLEADCMNHPVIQKRFRAVCTDFKYCDGYQAWNANYDVAVTMSVENCLNEAVDVGNRESLKKVISWSNGWLQRHGQSCGVVQRAVRLNQTEMMDDLLEVWDASCEGCKETPLGVAASEGNVHMLKLLLDKFDVNVEVQDVLNNTAFCQAVRHCNFAGVAYLIKKSDVNHLLLPYPGFRCYETPLLSAFREGFGGACGNAHELGSLVKGLVAAKANFTLPDQGNGCKQKTALVKAIETENLAVVPLLLELGANPNETGYTGSTAMRQPLAALTHKFLLKTLNWTNYFEVAEVLLKFHADVNGKDSEGATLLMEAVSACQSGLVDFLLGKGADRTLKDGDGDTAEDYAELCDNETAVHEIQQRLKKP